jgi:lipoate-protein ligase A
LLSIADYDFPDSALMQPDGSSGRCLVWTPPSLAVVIGKGSKMELEIDIDACARDEVTVVRRGTGGCAVVISPQMAVVTFALYTEVQLPSKECFKLFNLAIIVALEKQDIADLSHRGISDIALGDRKIAGTAIYRKRDLIFYHAILNVSGTTAAMEKYLKHPPRTPDYRQHRSHAEFVTSLTAQGYSLDHPAFTLHIDTEFTALLNMHSSPSKD